MTEQAAQNIPRPLLLALILIYCIAGFWGREPFKPLEINQLGWLFLYSDHGTTSKAIELGFDPLLHPESFVIFKTIWWNELNPKFVFWGFQAISFFVLCLTMFFIWHAAKRFASLSAAQPVTFAFGGEAKSSTYSVAIADSTVMALIAALGFSQFGHESSPFIFQIACVSALMMALSVTQGSGLIRLISRSLPLICLAFAGAPLLAVLLCLTLVVQSVLARSAGPRPKEILLHLILMVGLIPFIVWSFGEDLTYSLEIHRRDGLIRTFQLLVWFTWPIWPMAIWTMWKWRQHWWSKDASIHLLSPVLLTTTIILHAFWLGHNDRWYFLSLPPLSLLAALALPTLTRSVSSVIDWFTMLLFSGSGLLIWLFWIAGISGWPYGLVAHLEKAIPQFKLTFSLFQFFIALVTTLGWLWLVSWRTGRHRTALWKSLALPAGGAATCWVLLTSLWLPYLNQSRSLAELGQQLLESLSSQSCVYAWNLSQEQTSALYYYGTIKHLITPTNLTTDDHCKYLLANANALQQNGEAIDQHMWKKVTTLLGNRLNTDDDLVVFSRR